MQQLPQQTTKDTLPCLLIPVQGGRLVIPNVTVAELIPYQAPEPTNSPQEWLIGRLEWRGTLIPVVSYEKFCGYPLGAHSQDVRIAVVNAPNGEQGALRFFGLVVQGIPSLVKLEDAAIKENPNVETIPGQAMAVTLETGHGIIPDLDAIEAAIIQQPWQ